MVGERINFFAAVWEIGMGRKSEGTDYVVTLRLVDQSYPAPGISINIFMRQASELPQVSSCGDLISLHQVEMQSYGGDPYCVFNKKYSSFALFYWKTLDFSSYQTSFVYHATADDDEFLWRLRTWLRDHQSAGLMKNSLFLRDVVTGQNWVIVCKVLHVCKISEDESVLFVWDGTDLPPANLSVDFDMEGEISSTLYPDMLSLPSEVLHLFPHVGSVLKIYVRGHSKTIQYLEDESLWVKLHNLFTKLQSGTWRGDLHYSNSKIYLLIDEDDCVKERIRLYNDRITSDIGCWPLSTYPWPSHITELGHGVVARPYATLMDLITFPEVNPCKLKCIIRVVASCPQQVKDFRSPIDGTYRVKLLLEDPTARIYAYICREDAEDFFKYCQTIEDLAIKMNKLLGVDDKSDYRCPRWVPFCLVSYCLDKNNPLRSRRYRICDTRLVG